MAKRKPPAGKTKAKSKPPARPFATKPARSPVNWREVEDVLVRLCTRAITAFAKAHADEVVYALFIDFAADWTQIRLHLNSPAGLRRRAEEYIASNPELYARRSVEAVAADLRWEPGDFAHFEINNTRGWKQVWSPYAKKLAAAAARQDAAAYASGDFVELKFLLTVSRALLRLAGEGALEPLKRTRNFRVCCMRPEERPEDAWRRLDLVHAQMQAEAAADAQPVRKKPKKPGRASAGSAASR
jgi:hypothetical protein